MINTAAVSYDLQAWIYKQWNPKGWTNLRFQGLYVYTPGCLCKDCKEHVRRVRNWNRRFK